MFSGSEYFHAEFPQFISRLNWDINCLELLAIVVACKLWGHRWRGMQLIVFCDNVCSVSVLNSFRTSSILEEFVFKITFILPGKR